MTEQFSVYWFDPEGYSHVIYGTFTAEIAVELAASMIKRPAAAIGVVRRIIITDADDNTVFEWKFREGVTFPPEAIGKVPR